MEPARTLPLETERRIDSLCREFEAHWQQHGSLRLESFLDRLPESDRPALFEELLRLEIELRFTETNLLQDLHKRFPLETSRIDSIWREIAQHYSEPGSVLVSKPQQLATGDTLGDRGRYQIENCLGIGGFGSVYRAIDSQLHRTVAVKLSHRADHTINPVPMSLADEARVGARLDHPAIVPVYDMGRHSDGRLFIVSKYIEGGTLADKLRQGPISPDDTARWIATVAEALQFAHEHGVVHRDIKPSNLLLDAQQAIFVSDFGLALNADQPEKNEWVVGTPSYMSPEQARGETHRVDARSDIFSVGVVLYEMLTGRRPFRGDTKDEVVEQLLSHEPRPPRQWDHRIPRELDRICMRAIAKRAAERFDTAHDLQEELQQFRSPILPASSVANADATVAAQPTNAVSPTPAIPQPRFSPHIVPKGLRSFDADDAEFFLGLLPGPRDRDGFPKCVQFWKRRIEDSSHDAFAVGLLYGPSGCGKSSLVKAGVLPHLAPSIIRLTVEASTDDTESRLLRAIQSQFPELKKSATLAEAFASLRRGSILPPGGKLLLVLDQFEQWLHGRTDYHDMELVAAVRQCDGQRLQCLLLIRDDFWLAANRFMQELEIPILESKNSALVDLFDLRHARNVLAALGQAYGALSNNSSEWTKAQQQFLDQAVAGLAVENKVICVRLALFVEMVKDKPWSPEYLERAGGLAGIGATYLEEVFTARTAPPDHRHHLDAIRAVLQALLPEQGVEIKGHFRTTSELREKCGYLHRVDDFESLLTILDTKLHLITPAQNHEGQSERCYQLTHDYLVPSLRAWLTRKQRETIRGRAELCLAERAAVWNAMPQNRQLPSLREWLTIRLWTPRSHWRESETKLMRSAGRYHLQRTLTASLIGLLVGLTAMWFAASWQAGTYVNQLASADTNEVPGLVQRLKPYRFWANPRIAAMIDDPQSGQRQRLHARLAFLPSDLQQTQPLMDELLQADAETFLVIRHSLQPYRQQIIPALQETMGDAAAIDSRRLRAIWALAAYTAEVQKSELVPKTGSASLARQVVAEVVRSPNQFNAVVEACQPAGSVLLEPLADLFCERGQGETERLMTTSILLQLAQDRPTVLARMLVNADALRFDTIVSRSLAHRSTIIPLLEQQIEPRPQSGTSTTTTWAQEEQKDLAAHRMANAALALMRFGRSDHVWPLLKHSPDPRVRSFLIDRFASYRVPVAQLVARLTQERDATVRRALLLALGDYLPKELPAETVTLVRSKFQDDPDAGIHGAAEWALRRWGEPTEVTRGPQVGKEWYVNRHDHTMVVLRGPVDFQMAFVQSKPDGHGVQRLHPARIERSFAIATKEVTMAQYAQFQGRPRPAQGELVRSGVSWYDAARYCNWLSREEGIPEDQWCYKVVATDSGEILESVDGFESRTGYRLPTEVEWDYACRSGTVTPRFYGYSIDLLGKYAWYYLNANEQRHPPGLLKPNDFGLFDTYGNLWEWCQDRYVDNSQKATGKRFISPQIVSRGGPFTGRPWYILSSWTTAGYAVVPNEGKGFRIVRTVLPKLSLDNQHTIGKPDEMFDDSLRVYRSGYYVLTPWHQQTGNRGGRYSHDPEGGTGFRVARNMRD